MNHRDRVLATLRHEEPDRVPIDFGGTCDTTIVAVGYQDLRRRLGLDPTTTRVVDIYQQTAVIEEDVRQKLGGDLVPVFDEPNEWREGTLADGSPAELPATFSPVLLEDGGRVVFDTVGNVVARMPRGGLYFDPVYHPLADATSVRDIERHMDWIVNYDTPSHLDRSFEETAINASSSRENTDYALVGFFGGHILQAGQVMRGWEAFLMDLLVDQTLAHALMDKLVEAHISRFAHYAATVGQYIDVVLLEEDLGMQGGPLMSPSLYRKMLKPHQKKLFSFVKSNCDAYLLLHSDGAIAPLIPDLIEIGVDALNPVQVSAAGMETQWLKKQFGRDIAFWGAGCESQGILPFGTPQEVIDEVKRRIDDMAPGGGFVFGPIHNVQAGVPPENVVAMFETARAYGAQ